MNRIGVVTTFDREVGLGTVLGGDGVAHRFHCVEIADGSRTIDAGAEVSFLPLDKLGEIEAAQLIPL